MRTGTALRMTVETRLKRELEMARARVEVEFERALKEIRAGRTLPDTTAIALHEAEQIVAALERVDGSFYRRVRDGIKADAAERLRNAAEAAGAVISRVGGRADG